MADTNLVGEDAPSLAQQVRMGRLCVPPRWESVQWAGHPRACCQSTVSPDTPRVVRDVKVEDDVVVSDNDLWNQLGTVQGKTNRLHPVVQQQHPPQLKLITQ
eukprot:3304751-Amphidinium_carterae.1